MTCDPLTDDACTDMTACPTCPARMEHLDWCCVGMHPPDSGMTCCTCSAYRDAS